MLLLLKGIHGNPSSKPAFRYGFSSASPVVDKKATAYKQHGGPVREAVRQEDKGGVGYRAWPAPLEGRYAMLRGATSMGGYRYER